MLILNVQSVITEQSVVRVAYVRKITQEATYLSNVVLDGYDPCNALLA